MFSFNWWDLSFSLIWGMLKILLGSLENVIFLWNGKRVFITELHQSYQFCSISKTPAQEYQWEINLVLQGRLSAVSSLYQQGFLCCLQSQKLLPRPQFTSLFSLKFRYKHGPIFAQQLYWLTVQIYVWNNISTHHIPNASSKKIPVWNQNGEEVQILQKRFGKILQFQTPFCPANRLFFQ